MDNHSLCSILQCSLHILLKYNREIPLAKNRFDFQPQEYQKWPSHCPIFSPVSQTEYVLSRLLIFSNAFQAIDTFFELDLGSNVLTNHTNTNISRC